MPMSRDNRITNRLVRRGKLPRSQYETIKQTGGNSGVGRMEKAKMTIDNRITNRLVKRGKLPKKYLEIYPQ